MIVSSGGLKIVDKIFCYPGFMSDEWIASDPLRTLIDQGFKEITSNEHVRIISAHGISKDILKSFLQQNRDKKILMTYCGENLFVQNKVISYAYSGLNKLGLPSRLKDALALNPITLPVLSADLPIQRNTYFRELVENEPRYNYMLTNDLEQQKDNIFFAPYFYFFCRDTVTTLTNSPPTEESTEQKKFCAFVVSNPSNLDRVEFFKKLSAYKKVDSFGKLLNNAQLDSLPGEHYLSLLKYNHLLYKKYKFVISFENSYAKGYITEKLINALAGGSIPVYRGAEDLGKYFNLNRIIDYNNYGRSYRRMIDKIIELDQDDAKYRQFVAQPYFYSDSLPLGFENLSQRLITFIKNRLEIN